MRANEVKDATIIHGDCLTELPKIPKASAQLVFADPPYNIGIDYGNGKDADRLATEKYIGWCEQWMKACSRILTPDGSIWVMINDEWVSHFDLILKKLGLYRRNWIIWYETFGNNCTRKFNRCKRHILYYVKNEKDFIFNREAVSRLSDRQLKYNDKRANPNGKIWDDVWVVPRVAGTHKERIKEFPTQVPLEIMRAIVGCAADAGDLVVDPFSGSATTGAAAIELGRPYVGIEEQSKFVELSRQRLAKTTPQSPLLFSGTESIK